MPEQEPRLNSKRERWNKRYAARELIWSAGPNALLAEEFSNLAVGRALDAACGEGRNALWLAEQGWQVTAMDFSDVAISKGQQIAERRGLHLNWQVADLTVDPIPAGAFDLVTVIYLHTDPATRAQWLPRLVNAVAPGGTFFYLGHAMENIGQGRGGPQDPELLPSAEEIASALPGFELQRAELYERTVDADPGHGPASGADIAIDSVVRAVRTIRAD